MTSNLKGKALKDHWDDMLTYAGNVQRDINAHFDKTKVDELCDALNDVCVTDPCDTDHVPEKIHLKEEQSLQANTS